MSNNNIVEEVIKYYLLVKNGYRHFDPQYIFAGMTTVEWIFPVPERNAVGTLDECCNGIVFIKFIEYGKKPECDIITKDFYEEVYGKSFIYRFSQNFSEDTIVYCQTRLAIVANIKKGEAFHVICGLSSDDYLLGIRVLNPQKNWFVVVKSVDEGNSWWDDYVHIMKLESHELTDTGWCMYIGKTDYILPHFPLHQTWFVHNKNLLVYDQEWNKIRCTDGKQTVSHPFSEVFNANRNRIGRLKDFTIHPTLPFGVIIEEGINDTHDLLVLRWDITYTKKKDERVISFGQDLEALAALVGMDNMTLAYQSFSPDGRWYVVGMLSIGGRIELVGPQSPYFIAIPIIPTDKKHPSFLDIDNLVVLGQVANMTSIAWTHEPTSYVVSNGELLHKWDLDELSNARVFEVPDGDDGRKKGSIFGKFAGWFGVGK